MNIGRIDRRNKVLVVTSSVSGAIERISVLACVVMVTIMLGVVLMQVTLRGFRMSVPWTEEFSRILLIWIGMVGAGIALKQKLHVGIDFFQDLMPKTLRLTVVLLVDITVLAFLVLFTRVGWFSAQSAARVATQTLRISMRMPKMSVPIGAILMIIHLVYMIAADTTDLIGQFVSRSKDDTGDNPP